jgi:nucleoside-diphosphate-sugar epimerase
MKILITGGAGFIGVNSANYFAKKVTKLLFLIIYRESVQIKTFGGLKMSVR